MGPAESDSVKKSGVTFEICTEVAFKNRWLQIYWISIWMMKNIVLPPPSGQIWPDLIYFSNEPSMHFPTRRFSTAVQLSNQLVKLIFQTKSTTTNIFRDEMTHTVWFIQYESPYLWRHNNTIVLIWRKYYVIVSLYRKWLISL